MNKIKCQIMQNKGVVAAYVDGCEQDALKRLSGIIPAFVLVGHLFQYPNMLFMKDKFNGVAKLHQGDTWDQDAGCKIAIKKLFRKYYTSQVKTVQRLMKEYCKRLALMEELEQDILDKIARLEADDIELID